MTQHRQACVLEVNLKEVIAVTDDGEFIKVSLKGKLPEIGDIIDVPAVKKVNFKPFISFAAIAAVFLLMFVPYITAAKAVMWVSLDVNPSIELGLDEQQKIVELEALNEDAEKVLAHVNIKGSYVTDAIPLILAEMHQEKYISSQKENTVILSFASSQGYEELEKRTTEKVKLVLDTVQEKKQIPVNNVYFSKADKEERKLAQKEKISFGKYIIYKKARAKGLKITIKDMNNMPAAKAVSNAGGKLSELLSGGNSERAQTVYQHIYEKEKTKQLGINKKDLPNQKQQVIKAVKNRKVFSEDKNIEVKENNFKKILQQKLNQLKKQKEINHKLEQTDKKNTNNIKEKELDKKVEIKETIEQDIKNPDTVDQEQLNEDILEEGLLEDTVNPKDEDKDTKPNNVNKPTNNKAKHKESKKTKD